MGYSVMKSLVFSVLLLTGFSLYGQQSMLFTSQFAGSTGFLTFGLGIQNQSQKLQHELMYGFVPDHYGGPIDKLTYRFTWMPFKVNLCTKRTWLPFNPVAFVGYNLGKQYTIFPSYKKYDSEYYWWSTAVRFHVGFNTALRFNTRSHKGVVMVYLEANTNDRYITTYWDNYTNKSLSDLFYLGLGTKINVSALYSGKSTNQNHEK